MWCVPTATASTGERIPDTQTGLRGYPAAMIPWLRSVRGDRYEYELNLLLEARNAGYAICSVEIDTVYLNHNSGSHFRPWRTPCGSTPRC